MPNERAEGKKLIGAQASPELWNGVDEWLRQNKGSSVSDFILMACVEKLEREGIEVDVREALRDRRARLPAPGKPETNVNYKKRGATRSTV